MSPSRAQAGAMAQLPDELVREILLRVTPDDPACLLRAAVVCKGWRRILADPDFRCRHRELHPTPHVAGFLRIISNTVPYSSRFESIDPTSRRPAARDLPGWLALDCRHGRALFAAPAPGGGAPVALDLIVWNPLTDERRRLPQSCPRPMASSTGQTPFNAAVLCAATVQGCDHRGCHRGPFRVVFLFSTRSHTWARVYSSETDAWSFSNYTPGYSNNLFSIESMPSPSVLVGDALYFRGSGNHHAFEYQVTTHRLSVTYGPQSSSSSLMATADGEFHFTTLLQDPLSLCLWSREKTSTGVVQWVQGRAFNLEMLLPKDILTTMFDVTGSVEGADIIFVIVYKFGRRGNVYMVDLNSGKIRKVFEGYTCVFPYTSFCVPVIDEAYTGEEVREGIPNA